MKLDELLVENEQGHSFSCEFFPPRTDTGVNNLISRAVRLVSMGARFVSVTWGAGGTSADRSVELAQRLSKALGPKVPIVLHLTCTNMSRAVLDRTLARIASPDSGIDNLLALRGDRPRNDYTSGESDGGNDTEEEFSWAIDLVRYIKHLYGDRFCIGVAGYPEGFTDSPTLIPDVPTDLDFLADKVEAGASFVMTQLFYDPAKYAAYLGKVREHPRLGARFADTCIIPGLMPLVSYRTFVRSAELSHASIPIPTLQALKKIDTQDDEQVKSYGIDMLTELITTLFNVAGVKRVHFFTLNLEKSLTEILVRTHLAERPPQESPKVPGSPRLTAADWDEFTNGRYTDPSSAAFGEIDGYGPVVHGALSNKPNPAWSPLNTTDDISRLFVRHITNELPVIPFSEEALSAETALIQEELIDLNLAGMWTLASQPAAHAQPSTDRILGWGPPNGKVYQQAFVEFLVDSSDWLRLRQKLVGAKDTVFYAATETGAVDATTSAQDRNVVTWGVWADHRADSTIIAHESFLAWRDEAFSVLRGWQHLYPTDSPAHALLRKAAENRVLVTIIYKNTEDEHGLWDLLLQD